MTRSLAGKQNRAETTTMTTADPARVLADTIFRTRENLRYCKEHGIHLNGPKLGKPFADPTEARKHKKLEWLESGERGEIERNFGIGKRRYYYALT